jgi:hypothetical protein
MAKEKESRLKPVRSNAIPSADYRALLTDIKSRIRFSQIKASLAVNRELILLYWDIGRLIVQRQQVQGWGRRRDRSACRRFAEGISWFTRVLCKQYFADASNVPGLHIPLRIFGASCAEIEREEIGGSAQSGPSVSPA